MTSVGILLSQVNHRIFADLTRTAESLGYESAWLGEHLVMPIEMRGQLNEGDEHPPVAPTIPVLEVGQVISYLGGQTSTIRLGTFVYLLNARHPFITARAFTTADVLTNGRAEFGLGAGWLRTEYEAAGIDFETRGRRLDEAIEVCRRLWTEPVVEHHGEFWDFPAVAFEPKPIQSPLPIAIGGESKPALRRAARLADGWMGMAHTPGTAAAQVKILRRLEDEVGRTEPPVRVSVVGELTAEQPLAAWQEAGVDRLIVHPWTRTKDAIDGVTRLADEHFGRSVA
jgi:probable F420-dependent oxidoreductase